ncbi:CAAX amino terminal protease self- immunity [compost metagenome]
MTTAVTVIQNKGDRLALLYEVLKEKPATNSPADTSQMMADELAIIEKKYAPVGEEKMTLLPLDNWMVQQYGLGGFYIPLIGGSVRINANGAFGIYNARTQEYAFLKAGSDGDGFSEAPGWEYDYSATKPKQHSLCQTTEVMEQYTDKPVELQSQFDDHSLKKSALIEELKPEVVHEINGFPFWRQLSFALIAVVLFLVVPTIGNSLVPEESRRYLWVLGQHGTTALLLAALVAVSLSVTKSSMCFWGSLSSKAVALGFTSITAAYLTSVGYIVATGTPQESWIAKLFLGLDEFQASILIASLLVFPPLTEELLFRHFFVELMPYKRSSWWAFWTVGATSLAFAAMHSFQYHNWATLTLMFVMGAIFSIARIASRGLGLPLLLHSYAVMLGLVCNWLMN